MFKKYIILLPLFAVVFFSCTNNNIFPPITTEAVSMGSILESQVSSPAGSSSQYVSPLGSGALNFRDRDSTIITFYYKGTPGNTAPYQLEVYDSTANGRTSIYTFKDDNARDSLIGMRVVMPSHKEFAHYKYRISCSGPTDQFFYVKNLTVYKK